MREEKKNRLELSCREARLVLKVIPLDKKDKDMSSEEESAVAHYLQCGVCTEAGLSEILYRDLSCQEALYVWARKSAHLGLGGGVSTIREWLAVEHVWGRTIMIQDRPDLKSKIPISNFGACDKTPCAALLRYWKSAPLSMFYNGEREAAQVIPFIMDIFIGQKWPLKKLLELQRERISILLDGLVRGKLPLEVELQGHYHRIEDIRQEIEAGVLALQEIILRAK